MEEIKYRRLIKTVEKCENAIVVSKRIAEMLNEVLRQALKQEEISVCSIELFDLKGFSACFTLVVESE